MIFLIKDAYDNYIAISFSSDISSGWRSSIDTAINFYKYGASNTQSWPIRDSSLHEIVEYLDTRDLYTIIGMGLDIDEILNPNFKEKYVRYFI